MYTHGREKREKEGAAQAQIPGGGSRTARIPRTQRSFFDRVEFHCLALALRFMKLDLYLRIDGCVAFEPDRISYPLRDLHRRREAGAGLDRNVPGLTEVW